MNEKHRKHIQKDAENVKVAEVNPSVMYLKAIGLEAFRNNKDRATAVDGEGMFWFSEALVNQLMQYAYDEGQASASFNPWQVPA